MEAEKMYCPCCEKELVITHQGNYQSLVEHVGSPNAKPSMKDGWQCPNEYCIANNLNGTWIEGGEFFMSPPPGVKWTVAHDAVKAASKSGEYYALGSWQHYYELGKKAVKRRSFTINLRWYKFKFIPKAKGYNYPIEKQYQPSLLRWSVEIWKKSDTCEGCWTHVIPFWRMVRYTVKQFKNAYSRWQRNPDDKRIFEEVRQYGLGIQKTWSSEYVDQRFYYKVSRLYLRLFHPMKIRLVKNVNK